MLLIAAVCDGPCRREGWRKCGFVSTSRVPKWCCPDVSRCHIGGRTGHALASVDPAATEIPGERCGQTLPFSPVGAVEAGGHRRGGVVCRPSGRTERGRWT